ncbi:MAG TPA: 23S rRNA (uracil(1939)-C(5))-methyltransferase RlmD [Bacilli bacterium]|nr:23S rRNA (uracil(1939)-C(5))-methyltransferase RlmD [Bacilli bacterium]
MPVKLLINKLDNDGRGITYYNNKIMFVNNSLPKEIIDVDNIEDHHKYYVGNNVGISESSENRVLPKCPYYNLCGGCNIMHMGYEYQHEYKLNKVQDILKKYGNITKEVKFIPSNKELFYRNKIELKVINNKWGYYKNSTHHLCEIDLCLLASNAINDIINIEYLFNIKDGNITIRSNYLNEILIIIESDNKVDITYDKLPSNIKGIVLNNKTIYGSNYFYDMIGDYKFKVTYNSFFQINNYIANEIFKILNNNLEGNRVLDLYCGIGTMGLSLKDKFKEIYGIEIVSNAIEDAKVNAKENNIENVHYYTGNTNDVLNEIKTSFDAVILDPPRSGLNKETMDLLLNMKTKQIAYISCNPITLARDLKVLNNYNITSLYALDMFPNTHHVETVAVLKLKEK